MWCIWYLKGLAPKLILRVSSISYFISLTLFESYCIPAITIMSLVSREPFQLSGRYADRNRWEVLNGPGDARVTGLQMAVKSSKTKTSQATGQKKSSLSPVSHQGLASKPSTRYSQPAPLFLELLATSTRLGKPWVLLSWILVGCI